MRSLAHARAEIEPHALLRVARGRGDDVGARLRSGPTLRGRCEVLDDDADCTALRSRLRSELAGWRRERAQPRDFARHRRDRGVDFARPS